MPDNQFAGMDDAVSGVMQEHHNNTAIQIRNNIQSVSGQNPDQAAEYQHLAKFVNVPFETVQQHPELIKQQAAAQRLDADGLAQGAPDMRASW